MRIVVTGSSGFVGRKLIPVLQRAGHETVRLVRSETGGSEVEADSVPWNPGTGEIDRDRLGSIDACVHLAGENIATRKWNPAQKERIRDSRVNVTRHLSETLKSLEPKPTVLVCASAIGFYGDRGNEMLDEESSPGHGYLSEVCQDWEGAAEPAASAGIRVVHLRIGVVLGKEGGALKKMLPPFRMGVGGKMGSGGQFVSWIEIGDLANIIRYSLETDRLSGWINAVAPQPVTNLELTKALGKALHRPTLFPMPAFAVRLLFGEMGQELLLSSTRVVPKKLLSSGFEFENPRIDQALEHLLG